MTHTHASNCRDLLATISDYADGSLRDDLCRELEAHLAECQNCRIVVDTLKKTIFLYQTIGAEETDVPDGTRQRLFKSLDLNKIQ